MRSAHADSIDNYIAQLSHKDARKVEQAAKSLASLGEGAERAVPALVLLLSDARIVNLELANDIPQLGQTCASIARDALVEIGRPSVSALTACVDSDDDEIVQNAVRALGEIGDAANSAATRIYWAARAHPNQFARRDAIQALLRVEKDNGLLVRQLIDVTHDESGLVRKCAVRSLGQMGLVARPAVPRLLEALAETDERIARAAGNRHAESLEWHVQQAIVLALGDIGSSEVSVIMRLRPLLKSNMEMIQITTARTLCLIDKNHDDALQLLVHYLEEPSIPANAIQAAESIRDIGVGAVPALPSLIKLTKSENTRFAAYRAISVIGVEDAIDQLIIGLGNEDESIRKISADGIARFSSVSDRAIPALTKALVDERGFRPDLAQTSAAEALGAMGPKARDAIPILKKLANHRMRHLHEAAEQALRLIMVEDD